MEGVSILMPFRDAAATLAETLQSILAQSHAHFELLAVDDGSTDDSVAILRRLMGKDPRLRLLANPHPGLVRALNAGLREARYAWTARMDADDIMHPQRLAQQLAAVEGEERVDLVASQVRLFPDELVQDGYREYIRWQNECLTHEQICNEVYIESPFAHPTVMLRTATVRKVGGYRDGDFPEDYELWLRMAQAGCRMTKVPQVLLDWRERPDRTSRTDSRYARDAFDRIRAEYLAADARLTRDRRLVIWGAGRRTRRRADHLLKKGFQPAAWVDIDSRKIGRVLHGVPVVSPDWLVCEDKPFVLSYVANHGARELIGNRLQEMGYHPGDDYLMIG